jgi:hypothetical protein
MRKKAIDKKKGKDRGFLDWLVEKLRPGFHIAKNPPKGRKRPRKQAAPYAGQAYLPMGAEP